MKLSELKVYRPSWSLLSIQPVRRLVMNNNDHFKLLKWNRVT